MHGGLHHFVQHGLIHGANPTQETTLLIAQYQGRLQRQIRAITRAAIVTPPTMGRAERLCTTRALGRGELLTRGGWAARAGRSPTVKVSGPSEPPIRQHGG